jgi:N-acetylneuraminic acid mutarotase
VGIRDYHRFSKPVAFFSGNICEKPFSELAPYFHEKFVSLTAVSNHYSVGEEIVDVKKNEKNQSGGLAGSHCSVYADVGGVRWYLIDNNDTGIGAVSQKRHSHHRRRDAA